MKKNLKELYDHLKKSETSVNKLDISNIRISEKINNERDIPKSSDFSYIIKTARDEITKISEYKTIYYFYLFDRHIRIYFITSILNVKELDKHVYKILIWLHIINHYNTNKTCSRELNIYIYLTSLLKFLPTKIDVKIDKDNITTGFTTTCSVKSNIVIYRKEEWFKVFIHETFHNLALDFSGMDNKITKKLILKLFPVKSDIKLYEAYTDSWAKICNVILCSYFTCNKKFVPFITNVNILLNLERTYSCFQVIKVLDFMGLTYLDLHSKSSERVERRGKLYYEKTSILSYYIINLILLNNYQGFFELCREININLLQFDNTVEKQKMFCKFIELNYKTESLKKYINCIAELFNILKKDAKMGYVMRNMRKSLCELE